jgi:hypothetical protein
MKNQKPKQKATYLVALFESIAHPTIDCDKQFAKECARRCVDEITKNNPMIEVKYKIGKIDHRTNTNAIGYFDEVKQEIDKL